MDEERVEYQGHHCWHCWYAFLLATNDQASYNRTLKYCRNMPKYREDRRNRAKRAMTMPIFVASGHDDYITLKPECLDDIAESMDDLAEDAAQ